MNKNKIINGADLSLKILDQVELEVEELEDEGITPCIAFIAVGNDPASQVYVNRKQVVAESVGIKSIVCKFDEDVSSERLIIEINLLNKRKDVHGILVQLPLPSSIDAHDIINAIDPNKDVDGFTIENVGKLALKEDCLVPCTPQGCVDLIKSVEPNIKGMHAVIVGRSNIVGRPLIDLLLAQNCTVTVLHSRSVKPEEIACTADILIAALGKPKFIDEHWVKDGAIVIDVGINRQEGKKKLLGDVDFDKVIDKVRAITPVPGGVGPMTIAYLMKNTVKAAKLQR